MNDAPDVEGDKQFWYNARRLIAAVFTIAALAMTLTFAGLFVSARYERYDANNTKAGVAQEKYAAERAFYRACELALGQWDGVSGFGFRPIIPATCPR